MAKKISVDVNELIEQWRVKTNTLANQVGDLDDLTDSAANVVAAIVALQDASVTGPVTVRINDIVNANNALKFPVDSSRVGTGAITATKFADSSITTPKFVPDAVDSNALGANAVHAQHIDNDAIINRHYADSSIDAAFIKQNQVTANKFKNRVTFNIFNDSGNAVFTMYSPGSIT
mgnify:CR=1 FL=1